MTVITSPANPRITNLKHLLSARGRKKNGQFLLEGPHLLEAILDANLLPTEIYYHPELLQRTVEGRALLRRIQRLSALGEEQLVEVNDRVIEAIGEVQTSQGVVSVLPLKIFEPEHLRSLREVRKRPALLLLDAIADPGNMGTILRTALAADVEGVLLTPDCVDYFSPKVLRAAAGAHVQLPVEVSISWSAIAARVQTHAQGRVFLAEAGADDLYFEQDLSQPFVLIIGNEAHGPSREAHSLASQSVTIPLANGVESLNAAMATGILLYESVRQIQKRQS